ncbi:lipid IV(A) 4-amino-4-deoxy-L-arabinosyltransferase [Enterobacter sp. 638]|uniref:Undecaprenyl phosphate-alpha-4-amino-4-deoxy-L-arabinose arabinosyl transferase n=1 Tax=Enterobacter sp. (strain 638) TaxID=399742 RepID=ARNT_ENT38|nr:lipid IV(A) 4-amino-4-deoxy-L-arabinosyltransferase [Enterobacter sp. 638]A4WAM1.1 RecName: Full=Undecaprenyl phosphate-alpha-4-amino-4-deoxy-L-arabinose arabinosyl transferase; AltName: Full=4-amino-4-deoxy-L-arabinose lipid A transferase; AltName: Full=Lipid IV(A) 4-amino-4-deoxy-L-arabinosyltransferase; AltName: Full=Undecaprenyl phosphate-alpha-L-Ara4N transferase [Enterobacter sp. 638]ABP60751.1 glycosyl transferase, family 39 [Enterobacter sp. 638]
MKSAQYSLVLLLGFTLLYLLPLEFRALWQPDETRYAEISREMLSAGNWIVPHFLDVRYFEKPVAGYWINNLSQMIFGHNNFSVRFGAVFSTTLSALMVAWLAFRLWRDKTVAVLSGVIFLTCLLVYGVGTYAVLDPMITLWLVAAMCSFWLGANAQTRAGKAGGYILLGLACGMGVMTKGFLALAVPVLGVLPWVIAQKRWKEVLLFGPLAIISATLITLPWALAIAKAEPTFWHYFFWVEHIQRFAENDAQHKAPFWYYIPFLIAGCLPWVALLPGALKRSWNERHIESGTLYLLGWVVMPLLFFSIAKGKLPTYILPCFAPLAILLARHATQLVATPRTLKVNGWINTVFGAVCALIVLLVLAPWGIAKHPIYASHEVLKVIQASIAFLVWALVGYLTTRNNARLWQWAALCPLGIALLVGGMIPDKVVYSKHPQAFVDLVRPELESSRYILADSVGVGAGIAWEMKRSDITLYAKPGELDYGLTTFADAKDNFVSRDDFASWLALHRKEGNVSLVKLLSKDSVLEDSDVPAPDKVYHKGRFLLFFYEKTP